MTDRGRALALMLLVRGIVAERDAESVEMKLERLEAAIATAFAQGLKAGLAPKMLKSATQELEAERGRAHPAPGPARRLAVRDGGREQTDAEPPCAR